MAKLTLSDLASLANETTAIATINANNALIEAAVENTVSRDGTEPNTLEATLDANNNRILNLPEPISANEPVRLQDMAGTINVINGLTPFGVSLMTAANAAAGRTVLGLFPAATTAIGTSGAVLPLLNGNNTYSGTANFTDTTDASSSVTGAVKTAGGLGVAKKLFVGTDLNVAGNSTHTGTSLLTGAVTIGAGSTSTAPVNLTSGTLKTTAAAGGVEYDGKVFYATSVASARQGIMTPQIQILSANFGLTDTATAQKALNASTNGTVAVAASTSYMFDGEYLISNTGTNAHTWGVLIALTTATLTQAQMTVRGRSGTTNAGTFTADLSGFTTDPTTVLVSTASSTSSTEFVILSFRGILRVGTGGTITPQVKLSATTGGTITMLANSYFRIWPIGDSTVTSVGNWT